MNDSIMTKACIICARLSILEAIENSSNSNNIRELIKIRMRLDELITQPT